MRFYEDLNTRGKKWFRRGSFVLLALANLFLAVLVASYAVSTWSNLRSTLGAPFEVSVSGQGKISAKPDVAKVNATILTQGASLGAVQLENSKKSDTVVSYLKGEGIQEKDIKSTGYNINPQYSYPRPCAAGALCPASKPVPEIVGYQVRSTYEITIRDLAKVSSILEGIVRAGANEVSGISFAIDNPESLKAEAREKAVIQARQKADALASSLGKHLGRIVAFQESGSMPPPVPYYAGGAAVGLGGGGYAPSIEPGENEIVAEVSITYEFR